jgi:hypothetical protein
MGSCKKNIKAGAEIKARTHDKDTCEQTHQRNFLCEQNQKTRDVREMHGPRDVAELKEQAHMQRSFSFAQFTQRGWC